MSANGFINDVERIIGYEFKSKDLLKTALTHSSYVNEHSGEISYERLEFLGDALLDFIVAEKLFCDTNLSAGKMSKRRAELVSETSLSSVILSHNINNFVRVGKGSKSDFNASTKAVSDIFESLIGAVYIDSGKNYECAVDFVMRFWDDLIANEYLDYKTVLQIYSQKHLVGNPLPVYVEIPCDNSGNFCVEVVVDGVRGVGVGKSIALAEKNAAFEVVNKLRSSGKCL